MSSQIEKQLLSKFIRQLLNISTHVKLILLSLGLILLFFIAQPNFVYAETGTIAGTVYQFDRTTPLGAGLTVSLYINGALVDSTDTDVAGNYFIPNVTYVEDDIMYVFLDDESTDALTIAKVSSDNVPPAGFNLDLYAAYITFTTTGTEELTGENIINNFPSDNDLDDMVSIVGSDLTFQNSNSLYIPGNATVLFSTPINEINHMDIEGTLSNLTAATVSGDLFIDGSVGIIDLIDNTHELNGNGTIEDLSIDSGTLNITSNFTLTGDINISNSASVLLSDNDLAFSNMIMHDFGYFETGNGYINSNGTIELHESAIFQGSTGSMDVDWILMRDISTFTAPASINLGGIVERVGSAIFDLLTNSTTLTTRGEDVQFRNDIDFYNLALTDSSNNSIDSSVRFLGNGTFNIYGEFSAAGIDEIDDRVSINSYGTTDPHNLVMNDAASSLGTMDYLIVENSTITTINGSPVTLPINPSNSEDVGSNTGWFTTGPAISGIVYNNFGITNIGANKTVKLSVDGVVVGTADTDSNGYYEFPSASFASGEIIYILIDEETEKGTTILKVSSDNTPSELEIDIHRDRLIIDSTGSDIFSFTDIALVHPNDSDVGAIADISTALSMVSGKSLWIKNNVVLTSGSNITTYDAIIDGDLSLTTSSRYITVLGDLELNGATSGISNTGIIFSGSADQDLITGVNVGLPIDVDKSTGTVNLGSNLNIPGGDLIVEGDSTFDCQGNDIEVFRLTVRDNGTINCATGSLTTTYGIEVQNDADFIWGSGPITTGNMILGGNSHVLSSATTAVNGPSFDSNGNMDPNGGMVFINDDILMSGDMIFYELQYSDQMNNTDTNFTVVAGTLIEINHGLYISGIDSNDRIMFHSQSGTGTVQLNSSASVTAIDYVDVSGINVVDNSSTLSLPLSTFQSSFSGPNSGWFGVSIAGTNHGAEPSTAATFTVTLSGINNTGANLPIAYAFGGTAAGGSDYNNSTTSVNIPNGSNTGTITVPVLNDISTESTETITVTLASNSYVTVTGSAASRNIIDDDNDTVTQQIILASPLAGTEHTSIIPVDVTIPEAMLPGTLKITLTNSTRTIVVTLSDATAGVPKTSDLNIENVLSSTNVNSATGLVSGTIPDGVYNIIASYQDALGNPASSVTRANITINRTDNQTEVIVTKPTTTSTTAITDTTIHIEDPDGVTAGNVSNQSTANTDSLFCTQTSSTVVDCTVRIFASGDLQFELTDNLGIYVGVIVPGYVINTPTQSNNQGNTNTVTTQPASQPVVEDVSVSLELDDSRILLNNFEEYFENGKELTIPITQIIYFEVEKDGETKEYGFRIIEIGDDYVIGEIIGTSIELRLNLDSPHQFDVDGDSIVDIEIKLVDTSEQEAILMFKKVKGISTEINEDTPQTNPIICIIPIILLILLILAFYKRRKIIDYLEKKFY